MPLVTLVVLALLTGGASADPDYASLTKMFWQLEGADATPKHVNFGGQNFTTCCLKAVRDSIEIGPLGALQFTPNHDKWITFNDSNAPLDLLKYYSSIGQFPCGASYNGEPQGAPVVKVNYTWLADNCQGWQVSSKDNLNAWLQPLSGFLVPAVIFCLSVPRRRKLEVPRQLFAPNQAGVKSYPFVPFGAALAMIMVCIDTVFWLCVCFAFSGPMIISGLYEAMLDNAVLEYLRLKTNEKRLTIDMRCRCLMIILIGNLDLVWNTNDPNGNGGFVDGSPHTGDYTVQAEDGGAGDGGEAYADGGSGFELAKFPGSSGNIPLVPPLPDSDSSAAAGPGVGQATDAPNSTEPSYHYTAAGHLFQPSTARQPTGSLASTGASLSPNATNAAIEPSSPLEPSSQIPPIPVLPQEQARNSTDASVVPGTNIIPPSTSPSPAPSGLRNEPPSDHLHLYAGTMHGNPPVTHGYPPPSPSVDYGSPYGATASLDTPGQTAAVPLFSHTVQHRAGSGAVEADKKPLASPWKHMEQFLYGLRLYDDDFPNRRHSPRQYAKHQECPRGSICEVNGLKEQPRQRTKNAHRKIKQTKKRLQAMLLCQYSFGSMIGAPVVFFLGGFIFALLQSLDSLGDESIAIGLAFGQWYMTIPHIALVSGLLLAGNNPNILEGVLADDGDYHQDDIDFYGFTYGLSYPSCYKVASLWDRGYNKKKWLKTLVDTYYFQRDFKCNDKPVSHDKDINDLMDQTTLSLADWGFLLILTFTLLGVPFLLAFLTAFFTPEIGLSCRSLTFTVYLLVQICQIILWLWAYADPLRLKDNRLGRFLIDCGFFQPHSWSWLVASGEIVPRHPIKILLLIVTNRERVRGHLLQFLWCSIYFLSQWTLGLIGIMAAIGGTLLNLIGVYSANICTVTTNYWFTEPANRPQVVVSTNSAEMISYAKDMWKPCAITAIVFMSVVTFFGWWYQRRMRDMFSTLVQLIDNDEREDTRQSREDGGFPPPLEHPTKLVTEEQLRYSMPTAIVPPPSEIGSVATPVRGYVQHQSLGQPSPNMGMYGAETHDGVSTGAYILHAYPAGDFRPGGGGDTPGSVAMAGGDSSGGLFGSSRRARYTRVPSLQDPFDVSGPSASG